MRWGGGGASLSDEAKRQLYPRMQALLHEKNRLQQAEVLLNWVQTAFQYRTDQEQFGCERSLFADESPHYRYCDCEDRSILFSILVRDLLGLDVVLLHYLEVLCNPKGASAERRSPLQIVVEEVSSGASGGARSRR